MFWRIVNDVKEMVSDIAESEYPKVPVYIAIDHFWHWAKDYLSKEEAKEIYANLHSFSFLASKYFFPSTI